MTEHDIDEAGQHLVLRPSPLAPLDGGAALSSVSQRPAGFWPKPFSQPSSFIYRPRDRVWVAYIGEVLDNVNVIREDALDRRMVHAHGRVRAMSIARGEDVGTITDLAKWQAFGG